MRRDSSKHTLVLKDIRDGFLEALDSGWYVREEAKDRIALIGRWTNMEVGGSRLQRRG